MPIIYFFWLVVILILFKIARRYQKKEISAREFFIWSSFWILVGVGAFFARHLDVVAQALGVERAIDLAVYIALAALFYLTFKIFVKLERLEQDITKITRREALKVRDSGLPSTSLDEKNFPKE